MKRQALGGGGSRADPDRRRPATGWRPWPDVSWPRAAPGCHRSRLSHGRDCEGLGRKHRRRHRVTRGRCDVLWRGRACRMSPRALSTEGWECRLEIHARVVRSVVIPQTRRRRIRLGHPPGPADPRTAGPARRRALGPATRRRALGLATRPRVALGQDPATRRPAMPTLSRSARAPAPHRRAAVPGQPTVVPPSASARSPAWARRPSRYARPLPQRPHCRWADARDLGFRTCVGTSARIST